MGRQAEGPRPPWGWLAAAILSSCFLLTQTQTVEIIPVRMGSSHPLKGGNITLTPEGKPNFIICSWYRGEQAEANRIFTYISTPPEQQNGPKFTERETAGPGCSLNIRNLTVNDSGNYTVAKIVSGGSEAGRIHIEVLEKLFPPRLWPEEFFVKEHMNINLNCTTSEHSSITVSWFKDGKPVPTKAIPSEQNRTLTIPDISKDDEGLYTCEARNPGNSAMSNAIKVAVDSASPPGLSAGQIVGIVIGCLLGVALIVVVLYFALKSTGVGRMESHSSNGNIPSAPGRNQGVTDTKPSAGEEDIQYTTLAFNSNSPPQPGPGATSPLESGIIYSEIKKK